jgi:hypothetical protein
MRMLGMMTGNEPADYLDLRLQDLRDQMTDDELKRAMVPVWLLRVIEPGSDEAYLCRISAEDAPKDIEALLFQPVEVECRGLAAKGFIRNGQTKGTVEADTITFQAFSIKPLNLDQVKAYNRQLGDKTKEDAARKEAQRKRVETLRKEIEARLENSKTNGAGAKASK